MKQNKEAEPAPAQVGKDCTHQSERHASYIWVRGNIKRRLEWCDKCGALLDDRQFRIPLPGAKRWFSNGFGLRTLDAISKRYGKGWEDGVFHCGGIATGHWVLAGEVGRKIADILSLYKNETEFLADN